MNVSKTLLSVLCCMILASCGGSGGVSATDNITNESEPPFAALILSDKPKVSMPDVSVEQTTTQSGSNLDFALSLYRQVASDSSENIAFAPYSISSALSMLYAGAAGTTETEMRSTLGFTLSREKVFPAFSAIDIGLDTLSQDIEVEVVNNLWGQQGFGWDMQFLDILAENYGAGLNVVDFSTQPETIRTDINNWVADITNDRISGLLPDGSITPDTRFVITNAMYLNANWLTPFEAEKTVDRPFTLLSGDSVTVPTMSALFDIRHARASYYDVFELPYTGDSSSMLFLLPDAGMLQTLESDLSSSLLSTATSSLQSKSVSLALPSFQLSSNIGLKSALSQLGMASAFIESQADFSRMTGSENGLIVSDVIHQAFVKVDEKGTEAAAATGVIGGITSVPVVDITIEADRPFLFFIVDKNTDTYLFAGRVTDPR